VRLSADPGIQKWGRCRGEGSEGSRIAHCESAGQLLLEESLDLAQPGITIIFDHNEISLELRSHAVRNHAADFLDLVELVDLNIRSVHQAVH
jgi:hypothetical protein